jgi:leader peptidase (prepilin peptidase)/N-methyltransferase
LAVQDLPSVLFFLFVILIYPVYFKIYNYEMCNSPLSEDEVNFKGLRLYKGVFSIGFKPCLSTKTMAWSYSPYIVLMALLSLIGVKHEYLLVASILYFIAISDIIYNILSSRVTFLLSGVGLAIAIRDVLSGSYDHFLIAACVFTITVILALLTNGLGGGDIHLLTSLALIMGFPLFMVFVVWNSFIGVAMLIPLLYFKEVNIKDGVPFAPFAFLAFYFLLIIASVWEGFN